MQSVLGGPETPPLEDKKDEFFDLTSQFLFFKEIESFKKGHPEMLITLIRDDSMPPFFKVGDYVGGPILEKSAYGREQGNICIVEIEQGEIVIRQFFVREENKILLLPKNSEAGHNFILLEKEPARRIEILSWRGKNN